MVLDYDETSDVALDPELRRLLVCPIDHGDLRWERGTLRCVSCHRAFSVHAGIPNMLVDESAELERAE